MLRAAARFPVRGDRALDRLLAGGAAHLLAVAVPVLPFVLVLGYLVRVARHAAVGPLDEVPTPPVRPVTPLVREGIGAAVVCLAYGALPAALLAGTVGGAATGRLPAGGAGPGGSLFLAASTVTLVTAVAAAYPLPAALTRYATTGRLRAAFAVDPLWTAVRDARYFVAVAAAAGALGVAAGAYAPLNRVALGFFLAFYAEVAAAGLCARATALAGGADPTADAAHGSRVGSETGTKSPSGSGPGAEPRSGE